MACVLLYQILFHLCLHAIQHIGRYEFGDPFKSVSLQVKSSASTISLCKLLQRGRFHGFSLNLAPTVVLHYQNIPVEDHLTLYVGCRIRFVLGVVGDGKSCGARQRILMSCTNIETPYALRTSKWLNESLAKLGNVHFGSSANCEWLLKLVIHSEWDKLKCVWRVSTPT